MWFRRRRRQPPPDLSSLEASLDRLLELVERMLALIPELAATRDLRPRGAAAEVAPTPALTVVPDSAGNPAPELPAGGFVLFVGGPTGYRLLERDGAPPDRGAVVELDTERYEVLRLGPSPLPGDRRRCAFIERQEPAGPERAERAPELAAARRRARKTA